MGMFTIGVLTTFAPLQAQSKDLNATANWTHLQLLNLCIAGLASNDFTQFEPKKGLRTSSSGLGTTAHIGTPQTHPYLSGVTFNNEAPGNCELFFSSEREADSALTSFIAQADGLTTEDIKVFGKTGITSRFLILCAAGRTVTIQSNGPETGRESVGCHIHVVSAPTTETCKKDK